jgi:signal peptidase I
MVMNRKLKDFLSTSLYLLIVLVMTFLVVTYVGQRTKVSGASMEPTLSDGDNLLVDKISYRFSEPERFDIIVFPFRYAEKTYYIKRIIGLPGETVYIDDEGQIFINGELLTESYGKEVITDPGTAYEMLTLGDDEYFVLGDNRNNSEDSRNPEIGIVTSEMMEGRVWFVVSPAQHRGFV